MPFDSPLKPDAFQILLLLIDGPRHGYALMRDLAEATQGKVVLLPGALYRRLQQLLDAGWIQEISDESDPRRRPFRITALGREIAETEARRLEGLVEAARLRHLLKKRVGAKS